MDFRKKVLYALWCIVKAFYVVVGLILYVVIFSIFVTATWFLDLVLVVMAFFIALIVGKYPQLGKFKISLVVANILFPLYSLITNKKGSKKRKKAIDLFNEVCQEVKSGGLFNFSKEN